MVQVGIRPANLRVDGAMPTLYSDSTTGNPLTDPNPWVTSGVAMILTLPAGGWSGSGLDGQQADTCVILKRGSKRRRSRRLVTATEMGLRAR